MLGWTPVILRRAIVSAGVLVTLSSVAIAQERPAPASGARKPTHRFFDTTNIVLTGVETAALTLDGVLTQRSLRTVPGAYEADPIARPFVDRGWPGQIAGGALFIGADLGLRYCLHRKGHHRLERWVPMILTTDGIIGAADNAYQLASTHGTAPGR